MRILIIIPCYNEACSLPPLLDQLQTLKDNPRYTLDRAVINDCSTDSTGDIAREKADISIHLPVNTGIGGAIQTGLLYAQQHKYDAAIQVDGDGQHPPSQLPFLIHHWLDTKTDVIIGSRFLEKKGFQSSTLRRSGIRLLSNWLRFLTGKKIYDVTSGFRLLGKNAIEVAANEYPDEYPEPESLILFAKAGLQVQEVAVEMQERQGGQSSIQYLTQLYYIAKVSLAMFFTYLKYRSYGTHPAPHHHR